MNIMGALKTRQKEKVSENQPLDVRDRDLLIKKAAELDKHYSQDETYPTMYSSKRSWPT